MDDSDSEEFLFGSIENGIIVEKWIGGVDTLNDDMCRLIAEYGKKIEGIELSRGISDDKMCWEIVKMKVGDVIHYHRCTSWTTDRKMAVFFTDRFCPVLLLYSSSTSKGVDRLQGLDLDTYSRVEKEWVLPPMSWTIVKEFPVPSKCKIFLVEPVHEVEAK